ncbi:MAG: HEAT repeat domain-containing protein, partial [Bacteroidota bacterium]
KESFRELRRLYKAGKLNQEQTKLWMPQKPLEELYDLSKDPQELNNLAEDPAYATKKKELRNALHTWMVQSKDLGLLPEAEYMQRGAATSPYQYSKQTDPGLFKELLSAAEMVGTSKEEEIWENLMHTESGVRFWGIMAIMNQESLSDESLSRLEKLLKDPSPSVQIAAAEALCTFSSYPKALEVLGKWLKSEKAWIALQAARSVQMIQEEARPLIPIMYEVLENNLGEPGARLKYKDFNFAAFTSWALEWALLELGEEVKVN